MPQVVGVPVLPRPVVPALVEPQVVAAADLALLDGHWVGLSKYNDLFEHFDSYGIKPDKELAWINLKTRNSLGERAPYLTELLRGQHYIYNNVRFQQLDSYVNTCGDHVVQVKE